MSINNLYKCLSFLLRHSKGASLLPDRFYLTLLYKFQIGGKMDWENPKTFNQKIQWLKIHDRNVSHTQMVDKLRAKKIVADRVGGEYVIPVLKIWDKAEDIEFSSLPDKFVLKTTHGGGGQDVTVVKDKSNVDISAIRKKFKRALATSIWQQYREWPYKDVPRKIIAEEYVEDEHGELRDYKFFCMNGEPRFLFLATGRLSSGETTFDFLDLNYKRIPAKNGHPNIDGIPIAPPNFNKMIEIARKLSQGETFVRVDLYNVNGKIYFGEYTFFHNSGLVPFDPKEWDEKFGEYIDLSKK